MLMNGGTRVLRPVSQTASLSWFVAVAFLMPGAVSVTTSSTTLGSSIETGLPSAHSTTICVLGFT